MTDNRANEPTEDCYLDHEHESECYERTREHQQRYAPGDAPTEAQVEAATQSLLEGADLEVFDTRRQGVLRKRIRAALEAAAGVAPQKPSERHDAEERVRAVSTGAPEVQLLACVECGVLLWDIDAHYGHAHPEAECDHPNHGNSDHDCAPFSSATEPAAPSTDREKLLDAMINEYRDRSPHEFTEEWMPRVLDIALADQPVLDPEKVAEVLRLEDWTDEWDDLPQRDRDRNWALYLSAARALCEAAERGELT